MGCGHCSAFTATIRPFVDNPTFGIPVVFYSVPATNPDGPESPFPDRFWDNREGWLPNGVGTDPTSFAPYFGPVPDGTVSDLIGSDDEWRNGLSFAKWQAGLYSNPNGCVNLQKLSSPQRVRFGVSFTGEENPNKQVFQNSCPTVLLPFTLNWTAVYANQGTFSGKFSFNRRAFRYESTDPCGLCPGGQLNMILNGNAAAWTLVSDVSTLGINVPLVSTQCNPLRLVFGLNNTLCPCDSSTFDTLTVTVTQ